MTGSAPAPHDDLDRRVRDALQALDATTAGTPTAGTPAADRQGLLLFDAMAGSRLLDIHARRMREYGRGYYTIGSAGHESNAYVALALRPTDPALLHYRSGGFFLARALQAGRTLDDALRAVLLGMLAGTGDPASGGRHKVWGDATLAVIPQTSTIASHLPRALGVALAISRAKRLRVDARWPRDAVTVCSFGDASLNHSTATGALNAAGYSVAQGLPLPLLFVCEDNGIGISVPTPRGWVAAAAHRPGITYFTADGDDPEAARAAADDAAEHCRRTRTPALLHLRTVRYLSHAGSDVETAYRAGTDIAADADRDPLLALGRWLAAADASGASGAIGLAERYAGIDARIRAITDELADTATLRTGSEVVAPLAPAPAPPAAERTGAYGDARPLTLAQSINTALSAELAERPGMLVFGEDVGRKGGVYGVTRGLQQRFGAARVFDTLLDEQSILGFGLGLGVSGLLPVPEIQYLAYLHNAEDQLRGEAASLRFFSNGAFTNPMVLRIAGLAYQKGFGGHFHNDNAVGVLRDIPGLVVAVPAHAQDAAPMLRACLSAAVETGQVSVFLEPIALYHERDLHEAGDRGWLGVPTDDVAPIGTPRLYPATDGSTAGAADLTVVTFGNGVRMSLRVARRLAAAGRRVDVLDLRWIAPLRYANVADELRDARRILVVDETRHAGGVGEGVLAMLVEAGHPARFGRVASRDSYVPLGDAANLVLLGEDEIEQAALRLLATS